MHILISSCVPTSSSVVTVVCLVLGTLCLVRADFSIQVEPQPEPDVGTPFIDFNNLAKKNETADPFGQISLNYQSLWKVFRNLYL